MDEEPVMLIERNVFVEEPRLLLAAYICDDEGNNLEYKDYLEKGTTLKVVTEEQMQEVNNDGRRFGDKWYWNHDDIKDRTSDISLLNLNTIEDLTSELSLKMSQFPDGVTTYSYDGSGRDNYEMNMESRILKGYSNIGGPSMVQYQKFAKAVVTITTPTVGGGLGDLIDGPEIEPITTITPDPDAGVFHYASFVEKVGTHDKYSIDEFSETSGPEDTRKLMASEIYSGEELPSFAYRMSVEQGGLDGLINRLLTDPSVFEYPVDKLILDKNVALKMDYFKGEDYSIKPATYAKIFDKFKKFESSNHLVDISFPDETLEMDSLKLKSCRILVEGGDIRVKESLILDACIFDTNSTTIETIGFKGDGEVKFTGATINGPVSITLASETQPDLTIAGLIYNLKYDGTDIPKSIFNIMGFGTVKLMDAIVSEECSVPSGSFVTLNNNNIVKLTNFEINSLRETDKADVTIKGSSEVTITEFKSTNTNSKVPAINIGDVTTGGKVKLSDVVVTRKSILQLTNSKISLLSLNGCVCKSDKLYTYLDSDAAETKIVKSTLTLKKLDLSIVKGSINDSTINGDVFNLDVDGKVNLTNTIINSEKFNLKFLNTGGTTSLTKCNIKSKICTYGLNYTPGNDDSSKNSLTFVKSADSGKDCTISDIKTVSYKYSEMGTTNYTFNRCDIRITENKVNSLTSDGMSFNDCVLKKSTMTVLNNGLYTFKYDNSEATMDIELSEANLIMYNMVSSGILNTYKNDVPFKIRVSESTDCDSSAIVYSGECNFIVPPIVKDFKKFSKVEEGFKTNKSGKGTYSEIHYGKK